MPIYEYECGSCGHKLEKIQKISEDPLKDCPSCGQSALNKLISTVAFRLKGGGWYETDFKTGAKKNVLQGADNQAGEQSATGTNVASSDDKSASGSDKNDKNKSVATDKKVSSPTAPTQ